MTNYKKGKWEVKDMYRSIIERHDLMQYMDHVIFSDVNKDVVKRYMAGESLVSINKLYGKSHSWARAIVYSYVSKYSKLNGIKYCGLE